MEIEGVLPSGSKVQFKLLKTRGRAVWIFMGLRGL
jgi:hypothetical protein